MDEPLIGTTTPFQSGPGSNGYESVLHALQISELEPYHQFAVLFYTQDILIFFKGVLLLCKGHSIF